MRRPAADPSSSSTFQRTMSLLPPPMPPLCPPRLHCCQWLPVLLPLSLEALLLPSSHRPTRLLTQLLPVNLIALHSVSTRTPASRLQPVLPLCRRPRPLHIRHHCHPSRRLGNRHQPLTRPTRLSIRHTRSASRTTPTATAAAVPPPLPLPRRPQPLPTAPSLPRHPTPPHRPLVLPPPHHPSHLAPLHRHARH